MNTKNRLYIFNILKDFFSKILWTQLFRHICTNDFSSTTDNLLDVGLFKAHHYLWCVMAGPLVIGEF